MTTNFEFEPAHAPGVSRAAAESRDTTINVNVPKREAPPTPNLGGDPHSVDRLMGVPNHAASPKAQARMAASRPSSPAAHEHAPQIVSGQRINWGSVVGKVAIIAAVVVVGVVAFHMLAPAISGWAAGLGADSLLGTAINGTVSGVNATINTLAGFAGEASVYLADFGSSLWGSVMGSTVAASGGASVAPIAASTLGNAGAAIAVGGVAAAATPAIVKAVATMPVTETVHHVIDPAPTSGGAGHNHTGMDDGSMVAMAAKKGGLASQASQTAGMDLPDIPDEMLQQQKAASNSMKAASKMAHHADHENSGSHHDGADEHRLRGRARKALTRSANTNQAWLDRTGRSERAGAANHVEAAGVKQKSGDYTSHVEADRAAPGTLAPAV